VLDIFGAWVPMELCSLTRLNECKLFDWGANNTLPYEVLDALRLRHGIDVTGLNMSLTRGGEQLQVLCFNAGTTGLTIVCICQGCAPQAVMRCHPKEQTFGELRTIRLLTDTMMISHRH